MLVPVGLFGAGMGIIAEPSGRGKRGLSHPGSRAALAGSIPYVGDQLLTSIEAPRTLFHHGLP